MQFFHKRRSDVSVASVLVLLAISLVVGGILTMSASAERARNMRKPFVDSPMAADVGARIDKMMEPTALDSGGSAMGGLSSNPYDYVKENPEYRKIVALGYRALPALEVALNESEDSGLREYMICIAIEEITNCDLKRFGDSRWEAADGFKVEWPTYLESVPDRTRDIMSSKMTLDEKREELTKLGAPAVPYVVDNAGLLSISEDKEMALTVGRLLRTGTTAATVRDSASQNAGMIRELRSYVEGQ